LFAINSLRDAPSIAVGYSVQSLLVSFGRWCPHRPGRLVTTCERQLRMLCSCSRAA